MTGSEQAPRTEETHLSRRARRAARGDDSRRLNAWPYLIASVLVVLITLGALWWFLWRPVEEEVAWEWVDDPVDGVHARDVPPEDWEAGWCLTRFEDDQTPADVVDCEQSYQAQVMLRRNISDGPYPGDQVVIDTAHRWCHEELPLDTEAVAQADYGLEVRLWHPTESTWRDDYDRMVSCFLTRADGEEMSGSFLAAEDDAESSAEEEDIGVVDGESPEAEDPQDEGTAEEGPDEEDPQQEDPEETDSEEQ
ncbi:hypothetical protein [Nesterenkonia sp.]|uniref:hypothetical protein n=1 Tax=Nesterenkonia sp. TaxID=704201 RepID=UPI002610282A|nr:hypothetical protein [Nesterenkonia sp.]